MSFQRRSEAVGAGVGAEASSIPSDQQRRKPDDQTCCDGVVDSQGVSASEMTYIILSGGA